MGIVFNFDVQLTLKVMSLPAHPTSDAPIAPDTHDSGGGVWLTL